MRLTRAQNVLHLAWNVQNRVGFWGSVPDPAGGAYDALPDPLVVRGFLPSAIAVSCLRHLQFSQLRRPMKGYDPKSSTPHLFSDKSHTDVCFYVCIIYVLEWLLICVIFRLCGLSQNIEFYATAIPGADGVDCGAIRDDNADANHRYK